MSEKGIIKLVTNIVLIVGITTVCVALIVKGEIDAAILTILMIGAGYIVFQVIKRIF